MSYFDDINKEEVLYLNENISKITKFEIERGYYLRIYFNDGNYIELEPEYGAIYLSLKAK